MSERSVDLQLLTFDVGEENRTYPFTILVRFQQIRTVLAKRITIDRRFGLLKWSSLLRLTVVYC